jgi:crotonobetainyl-CoA:carnitine CoA-transferase CaiB-like acyl-CoA transferase
MTGPFGSEALRRVSNTLKGISVLDVSTDIAGRFCARLFADNGAEVTLATDTVWSETPAWRHLNAGKRVELWDALDGSRFVQGVHGKDVVVCSKPWQVQACHDTDMRIVAVLISPFGPSGPYAGWLGSEMIYQALSGSMPNNGEANRPPLYGCGNRASHAAGVMAYSGALAALIEREVSRQGQNVDVAVAEVAAAMTTGTVAYGYSGKPPRMRTTGQSMIRCSGEWILLWCYPAQWPDFCIALDILDLEHDPRFADASVRTANWPILLEILQDRLGHCPADEIVERLRARKLITAKGESPSRLGDHPHLLARDYWRELNGQRILGPLFRAYSHVGSNPTPAARPTGGNLPLSGLHVLDLTTAWAGPMAARILAHLGADVIHLEHASRPNLWRHHRQFFNDALYVNGDNPERRYNRNALFNSQNINKRSLCLDLKSKEGADLGRKIALRCDVILTNFTPGTLDRLGLGYAALAPSKSDIIVCEMPAYGLTGPQSAAAAVGATMEMAAAMSPMVGYKDGTPTTTGPNLPDPIGGLNAAAAILTAVLHRQMHGGGQLLEVAQVEAALQYVGIELLEALETGRDPVLNGNRVTHSAPHDAFPALGDDQWVAVAVLDETAWRALCKIIDPALARDVRFAQVSDRLAHRDVLDPIIAAWTSKRTKFAAAEQLQAAGIAAAPVLEPPELLDYPYFIDRRAFTVLPHAEVGDRPYHSVPMRLSRTPGRDLWAGPCLGEHTDEILTEYGLEVSVREDLALRGITDAVPS